MMPLFSLRRIVRCVIWYLIGFFGVPVWAQTLDPEAMLQRISNAARALTYSGVFVHSTLGHASASRITHLSDRDGEWEKIEALDGPPSEIIRRNDQMYCYRPDSKAVRLERRVTGRFFPSLLNGSPQSLLENYHFRSGPMERISGYDCQWVMLEPRDTLRYLQALCAEVSTGLLLRAKTLGSGNQILEQFTFTQLNFGKEAVRDAGRGRLKSLLKAKSERWRAEDQAQQDIQGGDTGWMIAHPPSGFRKVMEMKRTMTGKPASVSHLVYSDGMASVSVFIAPLPQDDKGQNNSVEEGVVSYAMRSVGQYQVTALGEVPASATQLLAEGVMPRSH